MLELTRIQEYMQKQRQAEEQHRKLNASLEDMVSQRTLALKDANQELITNVRGLGQSVEELEMNNTAMADKLESNERDILSLREQVMSKQAEIVQLTDLKEREHSADSVDQKRQQMVVVNLEKEIDELKKRNTAIQQELEREKQV